MGSVLGSIFGLGGTPMESHSGSQRGDLLATDPLAFYGSFLDEDALSHDRGR
jgi:hypothetical protein